MRQQPYDPFAEFPSEETEKPSERRVERFPSGAPPRETANDFYSREDLAALAEFPSEEEPILLRVGVVAQQPAAPVHSGPMLEILPCPDAWRFVAELHSKTFKTP
jgi:hypothetical protein